MFNRLIKNNNAAGGGCTDIVDNYDPFGGNGVALYQLNGDATDVSGNYNGTATNVTYGTGVFGQAGVFNGSSSKVELPNNVSGSGAFSVSTWINTSNITSAKGIFSFGSLSAILTESFIENGLVYFRVNDSVTNYFFAITTLGDISVNTWHNIVYVFPNTNVANGCKIYIDGVQKAAATLSVSSVTRDTTRNGFGGRFESGSLTIPFTGSIDQVRIFNTALTPLEVEALYTEELCICDGTVDTLDILGDGSCIATYQLDGNANDLSGNYSGTPTDVSYDIGYFDRAGVFNGSSSYIDTTYIVPASTTASISSWFNTSSTGNYRTLFSDSPSNGAAVNTRMQIYFTPTNTFDVVIGNNSGYWIGSSNSIASYIDGNWHNLIATYNGTDVKVYIDGSLFQSFTSTIAFGTAGNQSLVLGKAGLNNVNYWNGSIDQVRIFNRALNSSEVTTLYNETPCTKTIGSLEVGDFVEGGVVYWVDPSDDTKGLVVSINDLGFIRFCVDSLKDNIPSTSESLGQSKNSTDTIVGVIGTSASNAAGLCRSYDDNTWDLPTRGDMQQMYANKDLLNSKFSSLGGNAFKGASSQWYWTSGFFSQYESAREYRFSNGASELGTVITLNYVRACKQVGNW